MLMMTDKEAILVVQFESSPAGAFHLLTDY